MKLFDQNIKKKVIELNDSIFKRLLSSLDYPR